MTNAALKHAAKHHNQFLDQLIRYVEFPSVSAQPAHRKDMTACAAWLESHCREIGLQTKTYKTQGHPVLVARTFRKRHRSKPHFIVYGHYDVQPAEPFHLWRTPPFQPTVRQRALFARGASDNKGQHFAHLKAVESYLATGTELPCDLTFLIEGEEEVGSKHLPAFLRAHAKELQCNAIVISDTGIPSPKHPALTYALRGVAALEVTVHGPDRDLHSGIFGGSVDNPALVLSQMLAGLRDERGRVAVPGFYKSVKNLTAYERKELGRVPFHAADYKRFLGVQALFGEKGYTPVEQRSARPTVEINGLTSGYQGDGSKTIIPAWAKAKLTLRLVPDQNPQEIMDRVAKHLRKQAPKTVRVEIELGHGGDPYIVPPTSPLAQAALRALQNAFHQPPVLLREGGSIPIVTEFRRILGADTLLLGLALPDDNAHSPNEKFDLGMFKRGIELGIKLWPELSSAT